MVALVASGVAAKAVPIDIVNMATALRANSAIDAACIMYVLSFIEMFLYWFEKVRNQSRRSRAIALLACSPMMTLGAMVLAKGTRGITEASAIRRRSMP
jgi:hypothetical protein